MDALSGLVSVDEYLHTVYRPDCDYVDGVLVDRNVGEKDHAKAQKRLLLYLEERRKVWNIFVIQELRVRVSATRYRVPDICVVAGPEPDEQVFTSPPFLCIEVLSPEDRVSRMQQKIDDYLSFGVSCGWVVGRRTRKAWIYTAEGMREVRDGMLRTESPEITMPLAEVFES